MSKKSKRRNKPYTGTDAKHQVPTVHHYTAVVRSPLGEWWHDHQKIVKRSTSIGGIALIIIWLLAEAIHLLLTGNAF